MCRLQRRKTHPNNGHDFAGTARPTRVVAPVAPAQPSSNDPINRPPLGQLPSSNDPITVLHSTQLPSSIRPNYRPPFSAIYRMKPTFWLNPIADGTLWALRPYVPMSLCPYRVGRDRGPAYEPTGPPVPRRVSKRSGPQRDDIRQPLHTARVSSRARGVSTCTAALMAGLPPGPVADPRSPSTCIQRASTRTQTLRSWL